MFLEIVTPEASIFQGDVDSVIVPGQDGEFQMMNNHAAIVSLLQEGKVKISGNIAIDEAYQDKFTKEGDNNILLIKSGTVEMNNNKIIILVD
ncbi:ATP synthase epsilon chain [hydrothermal vent metagenome]|uniref:ATP synthase epsilon chain n=1 Tax=hydrothermal vent metagenome TaxID=652676 RepID=A0A3B0R1V9_9ZZZZ